MKITQDMRDYAAQFGVSETEALEKGMEEKKKQIPRSTRDDKWGCASGVAKRQWSGSASRPFCPGWQSPYLLVYEESCLRRAGPLDGLE